MKREYNNNNQLAGILKEDRIMRRMTLQKLAAKSGMLESNQSRMEKGERYPCSFWSYCPLWTVDYKRAATGYFNPGDNRANPRELRGMIAEMLSQRQRQPPGLEGDNRDQENTHN
ncbi:hypothetical protein ACFLVC_02500 [Chloroflexota bacterium]